MKLLRSLSFRLALLYAGLFGLSVLLLGGLYYAIAIRAPLEAIRSDLRAESRQLAQHRAAVHSVVPTPSCQPGAHPLPGLRRR